MTWQQGIGGWQWQQSGASSSSGVAPQVQQCSAKELEAWSSGTSTEWTCPNCQTVEWGEKEPRSSSFYDKSSILERMDTTETKQLVTSLSAATTSGGTTTICMWKRSSTTKPIRAYCRVLWVRRGHTANQASVESSQQSGRGYSSAGICEENVRTTTHRVEDTTESKDWKVRGLLCRELKGERRKRELRSLWPRLSKNSRTKKQREFKSNSVRSNKKLTKQLQKPQAHAHATAARRS